MPDKKLTICMVTNNYIPYSGGVVSSIQALTHELRLQGHRVVIVTLDFNQEHHTELDVERLACIGHFHYKKNPLALPVYAKYQVKRLMERYRPDIVHVHHPFLLGPVAADVTQAHNIPVIFTHHSLYEHYAHYVPLPPWIVRPLARRMVRNFCQTVDHVIVPSDSIRRHLAMQNISCSPSVIASGILPMFVSENFHPKACLKGRPVSLLSVSRFAPEKNIEWLLAMFAQLQSINPGVAILKLLGYGNWLSCLQELAYEKLRLPKDAVIFIEKPDKKDLVQAYRQADLFVFASQSETQGLVIAEAFSQGTPTIALRGPGIVDSIHNGINGFVVDSAGEMIEKIEQILAHENLFETFQKSAFESARSYFPDFTANQVYEVYQQQLEIQNQSRE